jgi:DNA-binding beta-propeller fold protein YncE
MRGRAVQAFNYSHNQFQLAGEWKFPEQCVEFEVVDHALFVTMTNFARGSDERSQLAIVDATTGEILSITDTGGEWSKVVKLHPQKPLAFVSNWHSHNVSVINVSDARNPKLLQIIPCGEAPRGIAFTNSGLCLVTGFYSARIYTLEERAGHWEVVSASSKFDPQDYSGNMRDILLAPDGDYAWVSNLGRNLIHQFDIKRGKIINSILVGCHPNAIRFWDKDNKTLLVSCREENAICFVDTKKMKVVGKSAPTGNKPTGLAVVDGGFLVTNFADDTLEHHQIRYD